MGADRQMIGQIMKVDHPEKLLKMYKEIMKRPKINYTYISFILARMIEYENSRLNYAKIISDDITSLTNKTSFYELLHKLELNLHMLKPSDISYLLYAIGNTKKLKIRFDLIVSKILEILNEDDNYELIENDIRIKIYLSCTILVNRKIYESDDFMDIFMNKSAENMNTIIKDKEITQDNLFRICKAHYKIRYANLPKVESLNKVLNKNKNGASPKDFYYWCMLNAIQESETETFYIILKDILNSKYMLKSYNFKMLLNFLSIIEIKKFEGKAILKKMLRDEVIANIIITLDKNITNRKPNPHMKELIDYLTKYKIKDTKLLNKIAEFYNFNDFLDAQIHEVFLFLYNNGMFKDNSFTNKIDTVKNVTRLNISVLDQIIDIFKKHELDPRTCYKKKIKLFVKRLKLMNSLADIDNMIDQIYPLFLQDIKYYIYFSNLLKTNLLNDKIINSENIDDISESFEVKEVQEEFIYKMIKSNKKQINLLYTLSKVYNNLKRDEMENIWRDNMNNILNMVKARFHPKYLTDNDVDFLLSVNDRSNLVDIKEIIQEALNTMIKNN